MKATRLFLLIACAAATGCAGARKPALQTYPWVDARTALQTLAARSAAVKTVQSEGSITVPNGPKDSVRLDGAIAFQPPDYLRLRAWKVGQAIFDATLRPDGLWIVVPDGHDEALEKLRSRDDAAAAVRRWVTMMGNFFQGDDLRPEAPRGKMFAVTKRVDDGFEIRCEVDRDTLTPRTYTLTDSYGEKRFVLRMEEYAQIKGIAWPGKIIADTAQGRFIIEMRNVEMNEPISPKAFVPPRRAEKLP